MIDYLDTKTQNGQLIYTVNLIKLLRDALDRCDASAAQAKANLKQAIIDMSSGIKDAPAHEDYMDSRAGSAAIELAKATRDAGWIYGLITALGPDQCTSVGTYDAVLTAFDQLGARD